MSMRIIITVFSSIKNVSARGMLNLLNHIQTYIPWSTSKMGGGDLNLKKSWHPLTLRNQEIVWLAEQKAIEEAKLRELKRKELEREKQMTELQKLQEEAGLIPKRAERLDWMYAGTASQMKTVQEEFLLGKRRIDQGIGTAASEEPVASPIGALFNNNPTINPQREWESKMREDPLFAIKKKEKEISESLIASSERVRKVQKIMEKSSDKSSGRVEEKYSSSRRRSRSRERRHESSRERDRHRDDSRDRERHGHNRERDRSRDSKNSRRH